MVEQTPVIQSLLVQHESFGIESLGFGEGGCKTIVGRVTANIDDRFCEMENGEIFRIDSFFGEKNDFLCLNQTKI